jgi:hypothetical protein
LEGGYFIVGNIEVCAWIPVLSGLRIIVQDLTVGIVERTFQAFAWAVFLIVLEDRVAHRLLLVAMYVL